MSSLEDIRNEFFGDRKHVFVLYGEPDEEPRLGALLSKASPLVEFPGLLLSESDVRLLARGLHPVMLVTYDYRFTKNLPAYEVPEYLHQNAPEHVQYRFTTYAVSENYAAYAFETFMLNLQPRKCLQDPLTRRMNYVYDVQHGETLQLAYFAIDPMPGKLALA
jgi:hypothetical protein